MGVIVPNICPLGANRPGSNSKILKAFYNHFFGRMVYYEYLYCYLRV